MKFCKECNNILHPSPDGRVICTHCGLVDKGDLISKEILPKKEERKKGVIKDKNIFATFDNVCKKCGYGKAEIINRGPSYSDEDDLVFYRCGKCGWTENTSRKIG